MFTFGNEKANLVRQGENLFEINENNLNIRGAVEVNTHVASKVKIKTKNQLSIMEEERHF